MGGGVSSLHRLRSTLIIRSYNIRPENATVSEHFSKYRRKNTLGEWVLTRDSICEACALGSSEDEALAAERLLETLFRRCKVGDGELLFEDFIRFIEEGTIPTERGIVEEADEKADEKNEDKVTNGGEVKPEAQGGTQGQSGTENSSTSVRPPIPPPTRVLSKAVEVRLIAEDGECIYPCVLASLGFMDPPDPSTRQLSASFTGPGGRKINNLGRPLWKKTETVIQERIVRYTTVDPSGVSQELVEREKNQTEVVHMECKETGEFAHRETTEYEVEETFNNEVVSEEKGEEEYVHLKSKEDEFEYVESNMPRKEREREERERMEREREERMEEAIRERMESEGLTRDEVLKQLGIDLETDMAGREGGLEGEGEGGGVGVGGLGEDYAKQEEAYRHRQEGGYMHGSGRTPERERESYPNPNAHFQGTDSPFNGTPLHGTPGSTGGVAGPNSAPGAPPMMGETPPFFMREMPPDLTEEEQVWWRNQQRKYLEAMYEAEMREHFKGGSYQAEADLAKADQAEELIDEELIDKYYPTPPRECDARRDEEDLDEKDEEKGAGDKEVNGETHDRRRYSGNPPATTATHFEHQGDGERKKCRARFDDFSEERDGDDDEGEEEEKKTSPPRQQRHPRQNDKENVVNGTFREGMPPHSPEKRSTEGSDTSNNNYAPFVSPTPSDKAAGLD